MDFISTALVTISQPTGFWETILNAFRGATGTYIMAVILLALIVRILFALVDIINKKVNMKNSDLNAKMRPELEAIQKRYGHDQRLLQQKTNEIYKKYQFSMLGSCLPMLITMALQLTVFLTLWNSLQAVSNFNIVNQYENMKDLYANVIYLNENDDDPSVAHIKDTITSHIETETPYTIDAEIDIEANQLVITITDESGNDVSRIDFNPAIENNEIYRLIAQYVGLPTDENPDDSEQPAEEGMVEQTDETVEEQPEEPTEPQLPTYEYIDTGFNEIFKTLAERSVEEYYKNTQEGFLWIKNIYKPESPTSPLFTKSEIENYMSRYYTEEERVEEENFDYEGRIFDNVVAGIDTQALGLNGYYILTIIAVISSFLSIWLSNKLMQKKGEPKQAGGKLMYFIMPIIIGIFTFMYTSLFAIYLIVGQLVMIALTPLTTWIVRKWIEADAKKKKEKDVIEVDYRRKDM